MILCDTITVAADGVLDINGNKNQADALSLRYNEIINGIVLTIKTATVLAGFTGGGLGTVTLQESSDGTNWSDVASVSVALDAADTLYTIRTSATNLPLKQKLRLNFSDYDSGNYIFSVWIGIRPSGE